jgi:flagellar motor switch protein FliG
MAGESAADLLPQVADAPTQRLPAITGPIVGPRKAAVLMAARSGPSAARLLQRMGEEEIESLSMEMASMSSVGPETTESVFTELAALAGAGEVGTSGGLDYARGVIERALGPERAAEVLGRLSERNETPPFDFLQRVPPERSAALLRSESPQTIALILASLHTTLAAQVLTRLPERQQPDIALRIARMGETSAQVVEQVEEVIRHKLTAVAEREYSAAGGTKTLAEILNHSDRTTERNVLEKLASEDKDLAEEVRSMLFVFEDIVKLEERAVQQVLREADQKDLVLALRGAPENVKEVVLTNMSERGAEMIKEEMEIQPPQRKRDIDAAQSRIVAVVRKLEETGAIVIASDSEDESEAVV